MKVLKKKLKIWSKATINILFPERMHALSIINNGGYGLHQRAAILQEMLLMTYSKYVILFLQQLGHWQVLFAYDSDKSKAIILYLVLTVIAVEILHLAWICVHLMPKLIT